MLHRIKLTENLLTSEGALHCLQHIRDFPCQFLLVVIPFAVMLKTSFGYVGGRSVQPVFQSTTSQMERCCGLTRQAAQHHTAAHLLSPGGMGERTGKVKVQEIMG